MIEKIKSLKSDITINLSNSHASKIYNLDSINLIIGNNGKGKTTLIKSIIRDLTSYGSPVEFIADGVTDKLGVIYYTATPFHKPMRNMVNKSVSFLDASSTQQEKQNFSSAAREYLEISRLLGVERRLRSIQSFDTTELFFELTKLMIGTFTAVNRDSTTSSDLHDTYTYYRKVDTQYNRTNRRVVTFDDYVTNDRQRNPDPHKSYPDEFRELTLKLENIVKDLIYTKERIAEIFLSDCGPPTDEKFIDWITSHFLLKAKFGIEDKRELAYRIYNGLLDGIDEASPLGRRWFNQRRKVSEFIQALHDTESGMLRFKKFQIEIAVNTPKLVKSDIDPDIIEVAHKLGLVRIGFDSMSSGEAAIMHQMISISHSIKELIQAGKKEILVFIDEGDLLLHLNWQREYISLIDRRLNNFKKGRNKLDTLQVVIASHSPLLASDILRDSITRLDNGTKLPAFGAPIQQIVNYSFGTPSIGLIAQECINNLKEKEFFTEDDIEMINQIDDKFIRDYMNKKASK